MINKDARRRGGGGSRGPRWPIGSSEFQAVDVANGMQTTSRTLRRTRAAQRPTPDVDPQVLTLAILPDIDNAMV